MSLIPQSIARIRRIKHDISGKGFSHLAMRVASEMIKSFPAIANSRIYKTLLYKIWLVKYDKTKKITIERELNKIRNNNSGNLVSVIIYVSNDNLRVIDTIESVIRQVYKDWELYIAYDLLSDIKINNYINKVSGNNSRIHYMNYSDIKDIDAVNETIAKTCGEYILFLNADDVLHPEALLWIISEIINNRSASIIYTDNDIVDDTGARHSPDFKREFDYELFLQQDMIGVPVIYKKECLLSVGCYSTAYDRKNTWDLSLKVYDSCGHENIKHIPRVLYHSYRRGCSDSVPQYCQKPVIDHLKRNNISANVTKHHNLDANKVQYLHTGKLPLVSLIIPTRNSLDILSKCIDSIINKTTYNNYEIIIVDNGSDDENTLNYIRNICRQHENITSITHNIPFNYSRLNNLGVTASNGDIVGLVNNDVEVINNSWMTELLSHTLRKDVGAVGAKLYYPDDTIQHAGLAVTNHGVAFHVNKGKHHNDAGYQNSLQLVQQFSAVTAACLFVQKSKYLEVGGLDENNLAVAFNDVDFCWKLNKAGYKNIWTPYAELYHHESKTRGSDRSDDRIKQFISERDYMRRKWDIENMVDPAVSPNLWDDGVIGDLYSFPPRL